MHAGAPDVATVMYYGTVGLKFGRAAAVPSRLPVLMHALQHCILPSASQIALSHIATWPLQQHCANTAVLPYVLLLRKWPIAL